MYGPRRSNPTNWPLIILVVVLCVIILGAVVGIVIWQVTIEKDDGYFDWDHEKIDCGLGYSYYVYHDGYPACVDVDECYGFPTACPTYTACQNTPGSYHCVKCAPGQSLSPDGFSCLDPPAPPPPDPNPCVYGVCDNKPNSWCKRVHDTYDCICESGYIEVNGYCQLKTGCTQTPCLNGGTCHPTNNVLGQYICSCRYGYSGILCQNVNYNCEPNPCMNGKCTSLPDQLFQCSCNVGYTGIICDTYIQNVDDCDSNPCTNEHSGRTWCVRTTYGYICQYPPGN